MSPFPQVGVEELKHPGEEFFGLETAQAERINVTFPQPCSITGIRAAALSTSVILSQNADVMYGLTLRNSKKQRKKLNFIFKKRGLIVVITTQP